MKTLSILTLLVTLNLCSCTSMYKSSKFTAPGSFTGEVEGPAVDKHGNLYAVSYEYKETIGKVTPSGVGSVYAKMPKGSTVNGIRFNSEGFMFAADYTGHNILLVKSDGSTSVFAHEAKMNQPNDLAIMNNDILFASDPNWAKGTGQLWRISQSGKVSLLEKGMGTTNGIEVSADQKRLYVNESKQRNVWVYDLNSNGDISNKRLFIKFEDGGLDGMRCDIKGNLYITRWGSSHVVMVCPEGKVLRKIQLHGEQPTNIAFGGQDGQTAYVTIADKGNIETFRVEYPGRAWSMKNK